MACTTHARVRVVLHVDRPPCAVRCTLSTKREVVWKKRVNLVQSNTWSLAEVLVLWSALRASKCWTQRGPFPKKWRQPYCNHIVSHKIGINATSHLRCVIPCTTPLLIREIGCWKEPRACATNMTFLAHSKIRTSYVKRFSHTSCLYGL